MFSLQKLFGQEDKIFGLLEASAEEARASARSLVTLSKDLQNPSPHDDVASARISDRRITEEIGAAIYSSFVTTLERDDIATLASALYKIPKIIEKFAERARQVPQHVRGIDFSGQINLIERATDIVLQLVQSFRGGVKPDKVKELNDRLHTLESEADAQLLLLYKDLFDKPRDPLQILALKDLYELLERIMDRCRTVGNIVAQIVLKNS